MGVFGIVLTLVSILAIAFGVYKIGAAACEPDQKQRDVTKNTSYVIIAIGATCSLCGMLSLVSGGGLPTNALVK